MITLNLIDDLLDTADSFFSRFSFITSGVDQLATYIHDLRFPQTLMNIFSICKIFLPEGTIITLFVISALLCALALGSGLIYFLLHVGNVL